MEPVAILRDVTRGPARAATLEDLVESWRAGAELAVLRGRADRELGGVSGEEFDALARALAGGTGDSSESAGVARAIVGAPRVTTGPEALPWGHPAATLLAEAQAIESHLLFIEALAAEPGFVGGDELWLRWANAVEPLTHLEAHFAKKEQEWFPLLEERGIVRPSLVMWQADDRARNLLSRVRGDLDRRDGREAAESVRELVAALRGVLRAETTVLVPLALEALGDAEWVRIRRGEATYGYCLIADPPDWPRGSAVRQTSDADLRCVSAKRVGRDALPMGAIALTRGGLTIGDAMTVLAALPVDLTFVDESDRVRFFNRTARPVFRRSAGAIGREVRYCHPPKSVHIVLEIVEAFRAGREDVAEFWFAAAEGMVHIRYFALRDAGAAYRGVLEVSQHVEALRHARPGRMDLPRKDTVASPREDARRPARSVAPPGSLLMDEGLLTAEQLDLVLSHLPLSVGVRSAAGSWHYLNRDDIPLLAPSDDELLALETADAGRAEWIVEPPDLARAWSGLVKLERGEEGAVLAMTQWLAPLEALEGERRILDWGR